MESANEIIETLNNNLLALSVEAKEKKMELDNTKKTIKQGKADYNREIKEYNSITKTIINEEKTLESVENKISKIKYTQKMLLTTISPDFVKHFNDLAGRVNKEIVECLLEFFGFALTPFNLLKKMIKDDTELKAMIEYSEVVNFNIEEANKQSMSKLLMINTSQDIDQAMIDNKDPMLHQNPAQLSVIFNQTREKIMKVKTKFKSDLSYPFDCVYDYISSIYDIFDAYSEREKINERLEKLHDSKNRTFIGLKSLESEILKNDSWYRTISKYVKSIYTLFERYKDIKEQNKENSDEFKEFARTIKEFKKLNINSLRRFDNMNSLTMKSEYSEEISVVSIQEDLPPIIASKSPIHQINKAPVESTGNQMVRMKTYDDKMKNAKKIKNKKLKLSNANSDLDIMSKKKPAKQKTWCKDDLMANKQLKTTKSQNATSFSTKMLKSASNFLPRENRENLLQDPPVSQGKSDYTIGIQSGGKPTTGILTCKISMNTLEKVRSFARLSQMNSKSPETRTLSEELKIKDIEVKKIPQLESETISQQVIDKLEASTSLLMMKSPQGMPNENNMLVPGNIDQLESVSDEWIVSPLNKIPIRTSKLISEKPVRAKSQRSNQEYLNLKIDKPVNSSGCCVSCV